MKKLLAVLVCLALVSAMGGIVGCDKGKTTTTPTNKTETSPTTSPVTKTTPT